MASGPYASASGWPDMVASHLSIMHGCTTVSKIECSRARLRRGIMLPLGASYAQNDMAAGVGKL